MKITVLALGSRGDVQPGIALGKGLIQAGHKVRLASYAKFADLAQRHQLDFRPVEGDITALLGSESGQEMLNSKNPLKLVRVMRDELRRTYDQAARDITAACVDAEAIVSVGAIFYGAASVAEAMNVPFFHANLQPLLQTRAFPNALMPLPPIQNGLANSLTHRISEQVFWQMLRPMVNKARRELYDLPHWPFFGPITKAIRNGLTAFFAYSRHVIPKPADWPANAHVTGYWFLDGASTWQPPASLLDFLAAGEPPVYVGFGSMNNRDPRATAELVIAALQKAGQRGILLTGWGGLQPGDVPDTILLIDSAPHDWLFPQMAAVVHHGSAGTTGAGLRSGAPSILVPFFADQPFWARYVRRLGVGPTPIPRQELTAGKLARVIETAVSDLEIKQRAASLGAKIRAEDGVAQTVTLIEQQLRQGSVENNL